MGFQTVLTDLKNIEQFSIYYQKKSSNFFTEKTLQRQHCRVSSILLLAVQDGTAQPVPHGHHDMFAAFFVFVYTYHKQTCLPELKRPAETSFENYTSQAFEQW